MKKQNNFMRMAQIENNTHCNYRCWFCQNRYYVRPPKKVMDMGLFEVILRSIRNAYSPEELNVTSFSVYNEPTLDPYFLKRIQMMTRMDFQHMCAINGSNLTKDLVDALATENITEFRINLPTTNRDDARKVMGISPKFHDKVLDRLDYLFEVMSQAEIPCKLMVNGNGTLDHQQTFKEAIDRFKHRKLEMSMTAIVNRAGMLDHVVEGKIDRGDIQPRLVGCGMNYFENLYFGIKGNLYVCCHDYYQKYTYGNINERPLAGLLRSDERKETIDRFKKEWCRHCSESTIQRGTTGYGPGDIVISQCSPR